VDNFQWLKQNIIHIGITYHAGDQQRNPATYTAYAIYYNATRRLNLSEAR